MLRAIVAAMLAVVVLAWPAHAQTKPETILVNTTQVLNPGDVVGKCFDLSDGTLFISAASPPGRTGESAFLEMAKRIDGVDSQYLRTLVTDAGLDSRYSIDARYIVDAGTYCLKISVTHNVEDPFDPNRPEKPNKQINILAKHRPS
jgi:hypothetical protein